MKNHFSFFIYQHIEHIWLNFEDEFSWELESSKNIYRITDKALCYICIFVKIRWKNINTQFVYFLFIKDFKKKNCMRVWDKKYLFKKKITICLCFWISSKMKPCPYWCWRNPRNSTLKNRCLVKILTLSPMTTKLIVNITLLMEVA